MNRFQLSDPTTGKPLIEQAGRNAAVLLDIKLLPTPPANPNNLANPSRSFEDQYQLRLLEFLENNDTSRPSDKAFGNDRNVTYTASSERRSDTEEEDGYKSVRSMSASRRRGSKERRRDKDRRREAERERLKREAIERKQQEEELTRKDEELRKATETAKVRVVLPESLCVL